MRAQPRSNLCLTEPVAAPGQPKPGLDRLRLILAACALPLLAAACTSTGSDAPAPAAVSAPAAGGAITHEGASGSGPCGEQIDQYRHILDQDLEMGHLSKSVFVRVAPEVDKAAAACREGKDAQARAMLAATKARYGYR